MAAAISVPAAPPVRLPTEDDLPYSDGVPMESQLHVMQMNLLVQPLGRHWADREDFYVGGNMFIYFNANQLRDRDFRGPDVFVALDVPRRLRKSWVVWEEGKGPDVVIELLSESTAAFDRSEKKRIYQDELRVPEYFWFDPENGEFAGFALRQRVYEPIQPDSEGRLPSPVLGLMLVKWTGVNEGTHSTWLRWATPDGILIPTAAEWAEHEHQLAEEERQRAEQQRLRAERLAEQLRALGIEPVE